MVGELDEIVDGDCVQAEKLIKPKIIMAKINLLASFRSIPLISSKKMKQSLFILH